MSETRPRALRTILEAFSLLIGGSLMAPLPALAQAGPCDGVIFRINGSSVKHVAAGAAVYGAGRVAGLPVVPSVGLAFGANLAKEFSDPCFDVADLTAGVVGALLVYGVERLFESSGYRSDHVEVTVVPEPYPLRIRVAFPF